MSPRASVMLLFSQAVNRTDCVRPNAALVIYCLMLSLSIPRLSLPSASRLRAVSPPLQALSLLCFLLALSLPYERWLFFVKYPSILCLLGTEL